MSKSQLIIFTDLDGTLLDHNSYQFEPATKALKTIAAENIPLIINSSKTFAEITAIQQQLNICQPFISENGAAAYIPVTTTGKWVNHAFTEPREKVLMALNTLRQQHNYQFTGFADGDIEMISTMTGLDDEATALAAQREFSEPLLWQDTEQRLLEFKQQLAQYQLLGHQGGRFLCVMGEANKSLAMRWMCQFLLGEQAFTAVALGDSPNDEQMLNDADIAVIIKSAYSEQMNIDGPHTIIRTVDRGPTGWQQAIDQILPNYINS